MDVVPLDVLLEAMTTDCSAVSARIQKVLLPSYFPGELPGLHEVDVYTKKVKTNMNPDLRAFYPHLLLVHCCSSSQRLSVCHALPTLLLSRVHSHMRLELFKAGFFKAAASLPLQACRSRETCRQGLPLCAYEKSSTSAHLTITPLLCCMQMGSKVHPAWQCCCGRTLLQAGPSAATWLAQPAAPQAKLVSPCCVKSVCK